MTVPEAPLWTIELTLIPLGAATDPAAREALRGIKARRRQGNPMVCACCSTTLGAAAFTMILGEVAGDDVTIPRTTAGLCQRCGPNLEAAAGKAAQIARGIWPKLGEFELALQQAREGRWVTGEIDEQRA